MSRELFLVLGSLSFLGYCLLNSLYNNIDAQVYRTLKPISSHGSSQRDTVFGDLSSFSCHFIIHLELICVQQEYQKNNLVNSD